MRFIAAIAACLAVSQIANAQTAILDVTNFQSEEPLNTAPGSANGFATVNVGAGSTVTGISYNFNFTTLGSSWLSEAGIAVGSTDNGDPYNFAFSADPASGTGSFSGTIDLASLGESFAVGSDGLIAVRFFEYGNDPVVPDGIYDSGTITFTYLAAATPEPGAWALMIGGFALAGGAARRKRQRAALAA